MSVLNSGTPPATARAFSVLGRMADDPLHAWGVRELARELAVAPSSVHRALGSLDKAGAIERAGKEASYRVSVTWVRLAMKIASGWPFLDYVSGLITRLSQRFEETVAIGVFDAPRAAVSFLTAVESARQVRYVLPMDKPLPLHAGASGIAILAFLPEVERNRLMETMTLSALTDQTITSRSALERACDEARSQGYAISHGQRVQGAVGIASPIRRVGDGVFGDVLLTIPEQRYTDALEHPVAAAVIECATAISRYLTENILATGRAPGLANREVR